jgi:hypothetical protein
MAKYGDGINYAKSIDPSSANIVDPGLLGGKVRVMQDQITIATTNLDSEGYVVVGTKLPTGSQVVQIFLSGYPLLASAPYTFLVGDEGDEDRYMTTVMLTAKTVHIGPNTQGGMYYSVTGVTDNYIRISSAGVGTVGFPTGGIIKVSVFYTVE